MSGSHDIEITDKKIAWVLWVALALNFLLFVVEFAYGLIANSNALQADSLDMLADAFVYGASILVLAGSHQIKSQVALLKGVVMGGLGIFVFYEIVQKILHPVLPTASTITVIGILALIANVICTLLLLKYRDNELNIRSAWVCSRNDALGNLSVILAGILVGYFQSVVPDIVIGLGIALLALSSSFGIIKDALPHVGEHQDHQ